jgi:hypothetical protein
MGAEDGSVGGYAGGAFSRRLRSAVSRLRPAEAGAPAPGPLDVVVDEVGGTASPRIAVLTDGARGPLVGRLCKRPPR